jgi:hypothetical protein
MAVATNSLTTLTSLKAYLGVTTTTDDALMESLIDRASDYIQRYCARNFVSQRYYEWHDTYGADRIALKQNPIEHVRFVGVGYDNAVSVQSTISSDISVTIGVDSDHVHLHRINSSGVETSSETVFVTYPSTNLLAAAISGVTGFSASAVLNLPTKYLRKIAGADLKQKTIYLQAPTDSLTDYMVDDARGIIYGPTLTQYRSFFVDYEGGYATVPFDLQQSTIEMASRLLNSRKRDPSLQSESLGGYSYSLRSVSDLDSSTKLVLDSYRRLR